jgi:hypothetical protein
MTTSGAFAFCAVDLFRVERSALERLILTEIG